MSKLKHDIDDDEIRIISSRAASGASSGNRSMRPAVALLLIVLSVLALCAVAYVMFYYDSDGEELTVVEDRHISPEKTGHTRYDSETADGYVSVADTVLNGVRLAVFTPVDLTPRLHIGEDILQDTSTVLAVPAADIRRDNGEIVGAYVLSGELVSKGQSKSGFCAIIDGKLTIGVADATPMLEQALESGGYFFRQYPLVVAGQVVENKPKGKSFRKALARLDDRIAVVMSRERMTFHDFSQSLVDLGVSDAIYLVGSEAYGFAIDADGRKVEFGTQGDEDYPNINYIYWTRR